MILKIRDLFVNWIWSLVECCYMLVQGLTSISNVIVQFFLIMLHNFTHTFKLKTYYKKSKHIHLGHLADWALGRIFECWNFCPTQSSYSNSFEKGFRSCSPAACSSDQRARLCPLCWSQLGNILSQFHLDTVYKRNISIFIMLYKLISQFKIIQNTYFFFNSPLVCKL